MSQDQPPSNTTDTQSVSPDPSMEDIIASISRIIAEDSRTSEPKRGSWRDKTGVLELTDAIGDDGSVRKLGGGTPTDPQGAPEPIAQTGDPHTAAAAETGGESREPGHALVSAASAEAAAAAFGRLGAAAKERRITPSPILAPNGPTLEEIVRDALRPLLRAWLDEHLPAVVERLVRDEIERLVRAAGPR
jgi:uncharacterized protein